MVATGLLTGIVIAFFWLSVVFIDAEFSVAHLMASLVLLWPFEAMLAVASALLAMVLPGRMIAGMVLAVYLVASYVLESLSATLSALETVKPLFLTAYFQGTEAINGDISWGYLAASLGAIGVLTATTVAVFERRDIGTRTAMRLRLPSFRRNHRLA